MFMRQSLGHDFRHKPAPRQHPIPVVSKSVHRKSSPPDHSNGKPSRLACIFKPQRCSDRNNRDPRQNKTPPRRPRIPSYISTMSNNGATGPDRNRAIPFLCRISLFAEDSAQEPSQFPNIAILLSLGNGGIADAAYFLSKPGAKLRYSKPSPRNSAIIASGIAVSASPAGRSGGASFGSR